MSLSTTSTLPLNTPRDGGSTTSLGSLFQYLTALSEKKFFLTKHPLASRPSSLSCRGLFGNDGNKRSCLLVLEQILSQFAHLKCSHVAVEEAPRACSTRLVGLCTLCQLPFLRKGGHWLSGLSVYFWWNPAPVPNHKNTLKPSEDWNPTRISVSPLCLHAYLPDVSLPLSFTVQHSQTVDIQVIPFIQSCVGEEEETMVAWNGNGADISPAQPMSQSFSPQDHSTQHLFLLSQEEKHQPKSTG